MEKTKTSTTIVECAILIAMAFALSFIKIIDMPYGGSVTAASMVPIIVAGYRHGLKWGLLTGFTYSILQLLMDLPTFHMLHHGLQQLRLFCLTMLELLQFWDL